MRHPRLKPRGKDTFIHVCNRTLGNTGFFPFGRAEKEEFIRRLRRLCRFYVIEVLAYQMLGNHFHLVLFIPGEPPSNEEAAERFRAWYGGNCGIDPNSERCTKLAERLRDISDFMHDLQQPFTRWFNRSRPLRRRGPLWAQRFKSTLLEKGLSVWRCWQYVEMNPVRAGIVRNPAEYRFGSFGHWAATGRHPFEMVVRKRFLKWFRSLWRKADMKEVQRELRHAFARKTALDSGHPPDQSPVSSAAVGKNEPFSLRLDRRVRYWADGLVIGSEIFVRSTIAGARSEAAMARRRLTPVDGATGAERELMCFKRLPAILG